MIYDVLAASNKYRSKQALPSTTFAASVAKMSKLRQFL